MPSVAVAHTAEKHRSPERVLSLVKEALGHLGGIEAFVKPRQTVLIIPNAADPLVVGALIHVARIAGAPRVRVADSSGAMAAIAAREGAELIDPASDTVPTREVDLPEGLALHSAPIPVQLLEADAIIAVPKAMNHYLDTISGVLPLWLGVLNQRWRALNSTEGDIVRRVADILTAVRPDLCVTDALVCGEGDGPLAAMPHWCGCVLVSADPVMSDVAMARLLRHDWQKLRFAAAGEERGVGRREPFVCLGMPLERFAFHAWPGHSGYGYLPVNFLAGEGVALAGTIGHVKNALDHLARMDALEPLIRARGTPTVMLGDVEDPEFERHIEEGPYLVFDDAARPEYRNDPRVHFVPGHPVLHSALPELMRGLGIMALTSRRGG